MQYQSYYDISADIRAKEYDKQTAPIYAEASKSVRANCKRDRNVTVSTHNVTNTKYMTMLKDDCMVAVDQ
ncbi:unnamed protein product [Oppiella nova]|uniref:Uncharacterized protein n=1 Tax=Oppiella nova TaxID=334625 RepID=A0A7R9LBB1_9ACAR|nr:unnamed protein product [Oppiella nova]CAG2160938.1 unnamed protein product [Oppiella nova]